LLLTFVGSTEDKGINRVF